MYPALDAMAELFGRIERCLFVDLYARGGDPNELKSQYLKRFGITARMFNAIRVTLEGKVKAAREARERHFRSPRRGFVPWRSRLQVWKRGWSKPRGWGPGGGSGSGSTRRSGAWRVSGKG